MYMWRDIEHKLSHLTGHPTTIKFGENNFKIVIKGKVITKFKKKLFNQTTETEAYVISKLKENAPQYIL